MTQLEELKKRLQQEFKNPQHNFITQSPFITLADAILLMGNFFSRMLSKPLAKEIGYRSRVPVLVLRNRI